MKNTPFPLRLVVYWVILFGLTVPASISAQPFLHPKLSLDAPVRGTATALHLLRTPETPQIGFFLPEAEPLYARSTTENTSNPASIFWQQFLLSLDIPFETYADDTFEGLSPDSLQLLIISRPLDLTRGAKKNLETYLEAGGNLIVTGTPCVPGASACRLGEILGASFTDKLPNEIFLTVGGSDPLFMGIEPGTSLPVAPSEPFMAAVQKGIGEWRDGMGYMDEGILLKGQQGAGRFVWMGFQPGDPSSADAHQQTYQTLLFNVMSYVAGTPSTQIRWWPAGYESASSLVALPASGYSPLTFLSSMGLVIDHLKESDGTATFFIPSHYVRFYPNVLARADSIGEIGLTSNNERVLYGEPAGEQAGRLLNARDTLARRIDVLPRGIYPPGGLYDTETLRAAHEVNAQYLLVDESPRFVPEWLNWARVLDYRDVALNDRHYADAEATWEPADSSNRLLLFRATARPDYAHIVEDSVDALPETLLDEFDRAHRRQGLFLYPFQAETQARTRRRARVLSDLVKFARGSNSWVATLSEIHDWWGERQQLSLSLTPSDSSLTLSVQNQGMPLQDVALDIWWPDAPADFLVSENAVNFASYGDHIILLMQAVPSGSSTIVLSQPPQAESDPTHIGDQ